MVLKGILHVEGNVQGVGYRAFVKKVAVALGIKGIVRNLPDGKVEISFEATDKSAYEAFYKRINRIRRHDWDEFSINVLNITPIEIREVEETEFGGLFDIDYGAELDRFQKETLERQEIGILVLSDFNQRTQENFSVMENKYGAISKSLEELKTGLLKELAEGVKILAERPKKD
ncbi:hypothetical protein GF318_05260 [Candidatus Micrarchaeota archaeon]|nr:hypothetical protein [Candidatus Micrarchaeota archaeon]